ncbi:unnamed protein product [Dibothriocephalus latus]|uniref:Proteasome subunit alpha type-2 n=1 Tax=Dibothriocephalus latus TaxID=60516 RepID=A0A3P7P1T1_DIBLA|nr:unnamed protein product [Dibothriocephalus latus]
MSGFCWHQIPPFTRAMLNWYPNDGWTSSQIDFIVVLPATLCYSSGTFFPWKATALGKNSMNGKAFLEKRHSDKLELEDAVHAAILTLKESFEGQMTEHNIEIAVCNEKGFRILEPSEIKDYLATIP